MLQLLRVLELLLNFLEGLFIWMVRPRVIILIFFATLIGGGTYLLYEFPVIGIAVKNFLFKTLPQFINDFVALLYKVWPIALNAIKKSFLKKYGKILLLFLGIPLLSKYRRKQLEQLQQWFFQNLTLYVVYMPRAWWFNLTKLKRYVLGAAALGVVISVPGLHFLGYLFFPYVLAFEFLLIAGKWVVTRLGAGALVTAIHVRIVSLLAKTIPTQALVKRKWRYLRSMILRRRRVRARTNALVGKGKEILAKRKRVKECKKTPSDEVPEEL